MDEKDVLTEEELGDVAGGTYEDAVKYLVNTLGITEKEARLKVSAYQYGFRFPVNFQLSTKERKAFGGELARPENK